MTRTTRHSDRRHDNDVNTDDVNNNNNNDSNNDNNNTAHTANAISAPKRTRRALHDAAAAADESASEFNNTNGNNNNDDDNVKLSDSTFAAGEAAGEEEEAQLPQFIASLHELISDPATTHVVTWLHLPDGRVHFVVKDVELFTQNILPKYYRTHKMTSFMRQLNNYGFSKVKSTDQNDKTYEFEHESNQLQPNRPDLLFKIERRRAVKRNSPSHGTKRARPSGQQLFRATAALPTSESHSLSPRGAHHATTAAAAAAGFERNFAHAMRGLPGNMRVEGTDDDDGDESAAASGPSKRRPARTASLAARNAIKAAVQDYDDNGDAAAAAGADGANDDGGAAADESSEFDDTQSTSEQSPRASMSQVALAERGRTQLNRLRLHEEQPLSLERVPTAPQLTTLTNVDDSAIGEPFTFAVPQVPPLQATTTAMPPQSTAFAFRLAPGVATAQNQPPQVVVQARVGLTKSGEVWKSMIQSTIVEPSTAGGANQPAVLFDMPRNNSVTDFFGIKREAIDAGDLLDTGIVDDTRAFLKSSAGINI